jgi:hypothetical protein
MLNEKKRPIQMRMVHTRMDQATVLSYHQRTLYNNYYTRFNVFRISFSYELFSFRKFLVSACHLRERSFIDSKNSHITPKIISLFSLFLVRVKERLSKKSYVYKNLRPLHEGKNNKRVH